MPATIKIDFEDNSKQWADDLTRRLNQVGVSASGLGSVLRDVGKQLDPQQVQKYRDEVGRLVTVFSQAEQSQRDILEVTQRLTAEQQKASQGLSALVVEVKNAQGASEAFRLAQVSVQKAFDSSGAAGYASELQQVAGGLGDVTEAAKRVKTDQLFQGATESLKELEHAAGPAQQRIAELNHELASSAGDQFSKQISKATRTTRQAKPQAKAKKRSKAKSKAGGGSGKSFFSGLSGATETLFNVTGLVGTLQSGIGSLAEGGSKSMQKLQGSFGNMHKALVSATDNPQFARFTNSIADGINKNVVPAIASLPKYWSDTQDFFSKSLLYWGELVGTIPKGAREMVDEMRVAQDLADEIEAKRTKIANATEQIDAILADEEKKTANIKAAAALQEIDNATKLIEMRDEEISQIRKRAQEGVATDEQIAASREKLEAINERLREVAYEEKAKAESEQQAALEREQKAEKNAAAEMLEELRQQEEESREAAEKKAEEDRRFSEARGEHANDAEAQEEKFLDLMRQKTAEDNKYLETLKGPLKEAEQQRLARARELREISFRTGDEQIKQATLLKFKKDEQDAKDKQVLVDKFKQMLGMSNGPQSGPGMGQHPSQAAGGFGGGGDSGGGGAFDASGGGFDGGGGFGDFNWENSINVLPLSKDAASALKTQRQAQKALRDVVNPFAKMSTKDKNAAIKQQYEDDAALKAQQEMENQGQLDVSTQNGKTTRQMKVTDADRALAPAGNPEQAQRIANARYHARLNNATQKGGQQYVKDKRRNKLDADTVARAKGTAGRAKLNKLQQDGMSPEVVDALRELIKQLEESGRMNSEEVKQFKEAVNQLGAGGKGAGNEGGNNGLSANESAASDTQVAQNDQENSGETGQTDVAGQTNETGQMAQSVQEGPQQNQTSGGTAVASTQSSAVAPGGGGDPTGKLVDTTQRGLGVMQNLTDTMSQQLAQISNLGTWLDQIQESVNSLKQASQDSSQNIANATRQAQSGGLRYA